MLFYYAISNIFVKKVKIPSESIRIRILANSNSEKDQNVKKSVKTNVEENVYNDMKNINNINEARLFINNNLTKISNVVQKSIKDENYTHTIRFGYNYFPKKEYKGIVYEEGYYESLLVTLGDGLGDNWWCVLFPPLCLLEGEENTKVEYQLYVEKLLNKYF